NTRIPKRNRVFIPPSLGSLSFVMFLRRSRESRVECDTIGRDWTKGWFYCGAIQLHFFTGIFLAGLPSRFRKALGGWSDQRNLLFHSDLECGGQGPSALRFT